MKDLRIKQISKFFHKRSLELILVVIIILVVSSSNIQGLFDRLNLFQPKQIPISSTQPIPSPSPKCTDQELMVSDLEDYLKNNGLVLNLLRKNCEIVLGSNYLDVTGDGKPEILLNTSFSGCASCHPRTIRVIDGIQNRIIFEMRGDDLAIEKPTFPINGIQIVEPLRQHDVGFCCATEGLVFTYIYSPKDTRGATQSGEDITSDIDAMYHEFASYNIVKDNDFFYLYDTRSIKFKNDEQ